MRAQAQESPRPADSHGSAGIPLGTGCSEHRRGKATLQLPALFLLVGEKLLRSSHEKKETAKSEEEGLQGKRKKI